MRKTFIVLALAALSCFGNAAFAQRYNGGLIDKIVAAVGDVFDGACGEKQGGGKQDEGGSF